MAVLIDNRQNRHPIRIEVIRQRARAILGALGSPDAELSVLLMDDGQIADLNRTYLNREGPTNVISFPMQEGEFSEISPHLLGDVVISLDTAAREAETAGVPLEQRTTELLIHGVLHLFGFDHEKPDSDAAAMDEKHMEILALLEKGGPSGEG